MSSSDWQQGADEKLTEAIAAAFEGPVIVKDWVLVVSLYDSEGVNTTCFNASVDASRTMCLGLLTHALAVEQAAVIRDKLDE